MKLEIQLLVAMLMEQIDYVKEGNKLKNSIIQFHTNQYNDVSKSTIIRNSINNNEDNNNSTNDNNAVPHHERIMLIISIQIKLTILLMTLILLLEIKYLTKNNMNNNNSNNNNINSSNKNDSSNKNGTDKKDKVSSLFPSQSSKEGDSMVKQLNGFLLTRKQICNYLVKVQTFSSGKVR